MTSRLLFTGAAFAALTTLSACAGYHSAREIRDEGHYWQRSDSVSAQYLVGPKAQHQLNKDIASCVSQVRELSRLGSIRSATPPDDIAMTGQMKSYWDTPRGDGPLHTEYLEFHDFESCMVHYGWARVNYVTPERAKEASYNYAETIMGIRLPHLWGKNNQHQTPKSQRGDYEFNQ